MFLKCLLLSTRFELYVPYINTSYLYNEHEVRNLLTLSFSNIRVK